MVEYWPSGHPRWAGRAGTRWARTRAAVLANSRVCWICHHGGADQVDHVQALSAGGDPWNFANLRPAHGTRGCPTCRRRCNQSRGIGAKLAQLEQPVEQQRVCGECGRPDCQWVNNSRHW